MASDQRNGTALLFKTCEDCCTGNGCDCPRHNISPASRARGVGGGDQVQYRRTWDPHFTVFGWWVRFIWGITFKAKRLRHGNSYGYHLLAVRLWGDPNSRKTARLIGVQWRRSRDGS